METNRNNVIQLKPKYKNNNNEDINNTLLKQNKEKKSIKTKNKRFAIAAAFTGYGILALLRYTLFFVLNILRVPIRIICTLFVFSSIVGIPAIWLGLDPTHELKIPALILMVIGTVIASTITWCYDSLLLRLAPGQMILTN